MELKDVKNITFPKPSYEEWTAAVEASLKGKTVDKLKTATYEGVTLQPLYTAESTTDVQSELPGFYPFTRGIYPVGYEEFPWLVCQPVTGATAEEANKNLMASFNRGQNAIAYPVELFANGARIEKLLKGISLKNISFYIDLKGKQKQFFEELQSVVNEEVTGVLAEDPIAEWIVTGQLPTNLDGFFADWFKQLKQYSEFSPELKTILVKTDVFHNGGANGVQELAFGLAVGVQYLIEGQKYGFTPQELADKMVFSFAIDSNYFMNIAKLRAARRLWAGLAEAFEVPKDTFKMAIHASTSQVTETLYDPEVNMLRTANQSLAAAVGGIQYLTINPYDHASGNANDFSERIARNTHLILKEETLVTKVVDPAGGSWYVEKLTNEVAEQAWAKFLTVDEAGGILEALKSGKIQAEIAEVYQTRLKNVASRKESIIGTNVYPNPADEVKLVNTDKVVSYVTVQDSETIEPIKLKRISEQFEALRMRSAAYKQETGTAPKVGLINIKELKSYKPRADFVKGLVTAGGIDSVESNGCFNIEDVKTFVEETNLPIYFICGSDDDYLELIEAAVAEVKQSYSEVQLYVAGKQAEELESALLTAGVKEFVHVKTNAAVINTELLQELGVN